MDPKENVAPKKATEKDEMNFKSIFLNASACMALISEKGKILEVSESFSSVLGYLSEELVNADIDIIEVDNEKLRFNTSVIAYKTHILHKSGEKMSIFARIKPIDDAYLLTIEKISATEKEKEENIFLNALMEYFPYSFYFKNTKSEFFKVSRTLLENLGLKDLDELDGKTDFDLFSKDLAQKSFDDEQEIIKTGEPKLNMEEREVWKDGHETWVSTSKLPLKNQRGEIIGTFGISRDITDRKVQIREIKEKTSILNAITNKMPVVIFKYSQNDGMTSLFGDSEIIDAFYNSKVARLSISESIPKFIPKIKGHKEGQNYYNFPSNYHDNEKDWYFNNFLFESQNEKEEYIGLALDVSEKKIAEYNLKRNAKNLEKINKELNQFAYIVSHDLKTPLRAITNLSEWIEEDLADIEDEGIKENLELLRNRVKRMEYLINGILDYSRVTRSSIEYENVNTNGLVHEIIESIDIPAEVNINIDDNLPSVYFPKVSLEQVFTNLITNAIKHRDKPNTQIDISSKPDEEFHEFTVMDNGPGIEKAYHEKIFQIFQTLQARDTLESSGVGLAIVKKVLEDRGGSIRVESDKGLGAKFIFSIPKEKSER